MQADAVGVLKQVIKKAKAGDLEYEKIVVKEILGPWLKVQAGSGDVGPKDRRPVVNIQINRSEGKAPASPSRIIDVKRD